ncbi:hypothetical protein U1Q18_052761 [Sarracenia purpurea var. burkii]
MNRRWSRKGKTDFIEYNMPRKVNFSSGFVKASITFCSWMIANKNTRFRPWIKFGRRIGAKPRETLTTENLENIINRWIGIQCLKRGFVLKFRGGHAIHKICGCG